MRTCPSCGHENTDDARFCSQCATPLVEGAPPREERKVVTCLFCDLVGFTARAEAMDPEDVRRVLQPYHASVRSELERFGGTVEKFIGDAVMAVFGAPVAHEDDPERAVRAALEIRDTLAEQGELEVRIGITTGEALVALDARPDAGEGMAAGDVVNTAARLQAAAPTNGILVDETTWRATERAIEYEERRPVEAKGKAEPIAAREALKARARVSVERVGGAPLVGRAQELTLLRETLARVVREREPQLVTLVGVPGIGKSRLVYELFGTIESGAFGLVYWRYGRSLPYGEGVSFWALGEIVKAQAGVLESDSSEQAAEKLRQAVARFLGDDADAPWIERQLRPLAGLERDEPRTGGPRDESFAAWRRFVEAIADERPLVLVFEDLHWADDALLDFVDYLADWASGVPLLVLGTARPELLTRRPGWGGGKVNSSTILLPPLTEEETGGILGFLLHPSLPDEGIPAQLLEHAGGNPLYAEEFARMLVDRPADVVLPETVQGIIAARLDTLPPEEKALLQDAAVLGRTFWLGALEGERWTLEERLHSLTRSEFVTRERRSAVAGESEYSFRHALVREVAYEQIPRALRAEKHLRAADWTSSLGRPEDHAELVAHHYLSALELVAATGGDTAGFSGPARRALRDAGDRALALHAYPAAARFYDAAVELLPADDSERPELLLDLGRALAPDGNERAYDVLDEAREALVAAGALDRAADASALLAELWWFRGVRERAREHVHEARALVEGADATLSKAWVLARLARHLTLAGDHDEAVLVANEALALAEALDLGDTRTHVLSTLGTARVQSGDAGGSEDLERAVELGRQVDSPELARAYHNLGHVLLGLGHVRRSRELRRDAFDAAERFGQWRQARWSSASEMTYDYLSGEWDTCVEFAHAFLGQSAQLGGWYQDAFMLAALATIETARADDDGAREHARRAFELAHAAADPQSVVTVLSHVAFVEFELGEVESAREHALSSLRSDHRFPTAGAGRVEALLAQIAPELEIEEEVRAHIATAPAEDLWAPAVTAVLDGEHRRAAELYRELELPTFEAYARLLAAEALGRGGLYRESADELALALAFFRRVGAVRYVRRCEALLAALR